MHRIARGLLAAAVTLGVGLTPSPAGALGAPVEEDVAPAVVLGLDSDDPRHGVELTEALRRAFAKRGLSGGTEANLAELRLALGCEPGDAECLARGGETLGARRLIYGEIARGRGSGWRLEVSMLEVETGHVERTQLTLNSVDLEVSNLDRTAERVAERLAPDGGRSSEPEAASGTLADAPPGEAPAVDPGDDGKGRLILGWHRPIPRWKWVGLGVSGGFLVAGLGATIGTGVWLNSPNGGFRRQLLDAAEASLTDGNSLNDVDPNAAVDLCELARSRPEDEMGRPLGEPGQVRNANVVKVCNKGLEVRKAQLGLAVVTGLAAASTLTFTALLFIHRERRAPDSAWRRHRLQVDLAPAPGGAWLGLRGRM